VTAAPPGAPPAPGLGRAAALVRTICEVPAPTFAEGARAELLLRLWRAAGLEPRLDRVGNVLADVPGGTGPRVVLAAHLDTVFEAGTDVRVRESEGRWCAPGLGDNSASLAVLTATAEAIAAGALERRPRLSLAATVGEEGLGDLRGAKALVADLGAEIDAFVAVDGHLGGVVDQAVGSVRFEVRLRGPGGHSWGDHGTPSAVHAVGDVIHALTRIDVPSAPRSSLNVGLVRGGSAINAIAAQAVCTLDLRSIDPDELARLGSEADRRARSIARRHGLEVEVARVGQRPAASGGNESLVAAAERSLRSLGIEPQRSASSTDANVAMAAGIPALCFGVYRGGDAHRAGEWIEPESLEQGMAALAALLRELAAS
jgi:tripeptide aminopeptidase